MRYNAGALVIKLRRVLEVYYYCIIIEEPKESY